MLKWNQLVIPGILVACLLGGGALAYVIPLEGDSNEPPETAAIEATQTPAAAHAEATSGAKQVTRPEATANPDAAATQPARGKGADGYAYFVNGNDKLPKLKRLYGEDTNLTLVAQNPESGEEVLRIDDTYHANANLNELLDPGTYEFFFFDEKGTLLSPSQDVGELVEIKR